MNGAKGQVPQAEPNGASAMPNSEAGIEDGQAFPVDGKTVLEDAKDRGTGEKGDEAGPEPAKETTSAAEAEPEYVKDSSADDEAVLEYAKPSVLKRPRLKTFFTFYGILLFVLPIVFLVMIAFLLQRPLAVFIIACVALIPALICFALIKYYLHDDFVPTSFLMDQIFIGAVPGVVISDLAIFLVLAIIVRYAFSKSIFSQFAEMFRQIATLASPDVKFRKLAADRYRNTDIYSMVVFGPLVFGVVASVIQEFAKLSVAFRCEQLLHFGPALGPRGALATAAAAGLGFATTTILCISLILAGQGISFLKVGAILLLSLWMLPLHVCTAFLMGVAIAKKKILRVRASVFGAYLTAVVFSFLLITGTLYLTGVLFYRSFFASKGFSGWIFAGGIIGKLAVVVALIVLCRRSYQTMDVERYHEMPGFEIEDADAESCEV